MAQKPSAQKWIIATLCSSFLGIVVTAILTAQHYRIASSGLMQKSFCTVSAVIDCDTALASRYAHMGKFLNSELGFLFFLVVAFLAAWGLVSAERRQSIFHFILIASTAAFLYCIYMAYILIAKLSIVCLFCIASHVLTLTIFLFALKITKVKIWKIPQFLVDYLTRTLRTPEDRMQRTSFFQYLITSVIIYGVGTLFFFGLNEPAHSGETKLDRQALLRHFYQQNAIDLELENLPSWGRADAPITVVEFSDFQCPFCRRAAFSLKPYLGEYRNEVRIIYMHYPLDSSCNPSVQRASHRQACLAAKAAICAYQKGADAFWKFHDLVFKNQRRLSHNLLTEKLAPKIGMTPKEMGMCMISSEIEMKLQKDIQQGTNAGVSGTPSIYINGRLIQNWSNPAILRTIIESEIKRLSRTGTPARPLEPDHSSS